MSKILTAYFSRAGENYFGGEMRRIKVGNTQVAVNYIKKIADTDVYEIKMKTPYSDDYKTCVNEAVKDLKSNARPQIVNAPESLSDYDTIILAYPNYCGTAPCAVFTFIEKYDLTGKAILPLCTNEGSGMGRSVSDIKNSCPGAQVKDGLSIIGSKVASSEDEIKSWLTAQNII